MDITKRIKADASTVLVQVFNEENTRVFYEHEVLLQAVFTEYSINQNNTYIELRKEDFVNMLKEASILKLPKVVELVNPDQPRKRGRGAAAAEKPKEKPDAEEEKKKDGEKNDVFKKMYKEDWEDDEDDWASYHPVI